MEIVGNDLNSIRYYDVWCNLKYACGNDSIVSTLMRENIANARRPFVTMQIIKSSSAEWRTMFLRS